MSDLFLYTVASSSNPDRITCSVPCRIDKNEIFFGPCKKRLRELLRNNYLGPKQNTSKPKKSIYLAGINGANNKKIRKIVWVGRIKKIMTFEQAYKKLTGRRYEEMRTDKCSPLLLRPVYNNGVFVGYEHRSKLHANNDNWVFDVVNYLSVKNIQKKGNRLLLKNSVSPFETFTRDCCIILENIFFATTVGIKLDKEAIRILSRVQPKQRIDNYAIFGYRSDGSANGLTGNYLRVEGDFSKKLVNWIKKKSTQIQVHSEKNNKKIMDETKRSC